MQGPRHLACVLGAAWPERQTRGRLFIMTWWSGTSLQRCRTMSDRPTLPNIPPQRGSYLRAVKDVYSGRIVVYSMATRMNSSLPPRLAARPSVLSVSGSVPASLNDCVRSPSLRLSRWCGPSGDSSSLEPQRTEKSRE